MGEGLSTPTTLTYFRNLPNIKHLSLTGDRNGRRFDCFIDNCSHVIREVERYS